MGESVNQTTHFVVNRLIALASVLGEALGYSFDVAWLLGVAGYSIGRNSRFSGYAIAPDVVIGAGVDIAEQVRLGPRVTIHDRCQVRLGATLSQDVVLGEGTIVCGRSYLENISVGQEAMLGSDVLCLGHGEGHIEIGSHSYIGPRCVLDWSDNLTIGDFVHVSGPSTAFWTHSSVDQVLHGDRLDNKQRRKTFPVLIEHHVYIGGNCTIYPGVRIGHHSIILPNSAVNEDVPAGCMVGGVPAKVIRSLNETEDDENVA